MGPQEIPERSTFWFSEKSDEVAKTPLFDRPTILFSLVLTAFTFIVYWPLVRVISLEEAFFTPLVPIIVYMFSIFGVEGEEALRVLFISSLVISTSGIYLLVRDLVKRQVVSILAAIFYLIPPIPVFVLTFFRRGLLEAELSSAKSFLTIIYGDGAHFLALALVPMALLLYLRFLKSGTKFDFALSEILLVLVLLANRSQALFLFSILLVATVTEMLLGRPAAKLRGMLVIFVIGIGLVSFWYTPSFWVDGAVGIVYEVASNVGYFFPLPAAILGLSLAFAYVFLSRRRDRQPIFMAFAIFAVLFAISFNWLVTGQSFLPHPQRLLPDILMFSSIVVALTLTAIYDKSGISKLISPKSWAGRTLAAFLFGVFSFIVLSIVAYIFSPVLILAVSGTHGIWARLRTNVIADRQEIVDLAGGSFRLVPVEAGGAEMLLALALSLVFMVTFILMLLKRSKNMA